MKNALPLLCATLCGVLAACSSGSPSAHPAANGAVQTEAQPLRGGPLARARPSHRHVLAWGADGYGQIGDGVEQANAAIVHPYPFEVDGLPAPVQLSGGDNDSLVLTADGHVWIWGNNQHGQLGDGTTSDRAVPFEMSAIDHLKFVAGGYWHNAAIKGCAGQDCSEDGSVWAWGENAFGELGQGQTGPDVLAPVRVSLPKKATKLATGGEFTMALLEDGTVWGWGNNYSGQLGGGTCPSDPMQPCTYAPTPFEITEVSALGRVVDLAGQYQHTLFVLEDGSLYAMGQNGLGELGIGSQDPSNGFLRHGPVRVAALASKRVKSVAAGVGHSLALDSDGVVYGWGYNPEGEAGEGPVYVTSPQEITCAGQPCLRGATEIQAGHYTSEALVHGHVWAWGRADFGELGQIVRCCSAKPLEVPGVSGVELLSTISEHTLAYGRYRPDEVACAHPSSYWLQELAPLPGDVNAVALALSNEGMAVGISYGADGSDHAVIWGYDEIPQPLGALPGDVGSWAVAVNDEGEAVGYSSPEATVQPLVNAKPVRFTGRSATALPTLAGSSSTLSAVFGINDSGIAVGGGVVSGLAHALEYRGDQAIDLGSGIGNMTASGINDSGEIVGATFNATAHEVVRITPGGLSPLGSTPAPYTDCDIYNVSEAGEAAGYCSTAGTLTTQAVVFRAGAAVLLGMLPGDRSSYAWFVNDRGQAVGHSSATTSTRAALFDGGQVIDLNTRVQAIGTWSLAEAVAINDNGQIVGLGTPSGPGCNPSVGCASTEQAFILTPTCDDP